MITISKEDYVQLKVAEATLDRLAGGGVDNWSGYGECFDGWDEEEEQINKEAENLDKPSEA